MRQNKLSEMIAPSHLHATKFPLQQIKLQKSLYQPANQIYSNYLQKPEPKHKLDYLYPRKDLEKLMPVELHSQHKHRSKSQYQLK